MWTSENRARYDRDELRYPSDVTAAEWALIEPLIPAAKRGGRRTKTGMRQTFNAVMYLLSTGCQWRYLPKDFPPQGTVRRYFDAWNWRGGLGRMHDALYEFCRARGARGQPHRRDHRQSEREERRKRRVSIDPHGFDAGKKIKGKKRHILVDTRGLLLIAIVHSAGIQDRDGGVLLFSTLFGRFPFLKKLFADSAYQGTLFATAIGAILPSLHIEIVKRSDRAKRFVILPKRWIVERSIAWLSRCRRLAKDWENLNRTALAFLHFASIRLMLRKLSNPS